MDGSGGAAILCDGIRFFGSRRVEGAREEEDSWLNGEAEAEAEAEAETEAKCGLVVAEGLLPIVMMTTT